MPGRFLADFALTLAEEKRANIKIGIVVACDEARFPSDERLVAGQFCDGICGECDRLVVPAGELKLISGEELDQCVDDGRKWCLALGVPRVVSGLSHGDPVVRTPCRHRVVG